MVDRDPRDIARIADLEVEVATKDLLIGKLEAQVSRVGDLERKVEELTKLVMKLQEELGRNSGNSNMPPSSDSPSERAERRGGAKSKRKRGGQPGHSGSSRGLVPPEQVSEFVHLFPSNCEDCRAALPETPDPEAQRFQVTELEVKRRVTEYQRHGVVCPCCANKNWAPADEVPSSPFGPRLSSVVGLITGVYHLSRRVAVDLFADVLGVDISLGGISGIEARVSEAVKPAVDEVSKKVEQAPVKHTDGTSWFQSGVLCSLWTIATTAATLFKITVNGQKDTLAPLFGALVGILVSDRATALTFWAMERRQICWAHLLRKFIWFSERGGPAGALGRELLDYLAIMFTYWDQLRAGTMSRDQFRTLMAPLRKQVEAALARGRDAGLPHVSGSCEDILDHKAALWTFVDRDDVDPTNNHAERELRAFVLWRKRSFGTQSVRVNDFPERLMTVAHTARKQNKNVLAFLTACCTAALNGEAAPSLFESAAA